jgi:hypothetical protein
LEGLDQQPATGDKTVTLFTTIHLHNVPAGRIAYAGDLSVYDDQK